LEKTNPRCESSPSASTDRYIEIQRLKKCGLGRERFTSLGKLDQASVRWRIGNIILEASVLSRLDVVRIDVEVQKVLQGLRVSKENTGTCVDLGLGGPARASGLDAHTTAKVRGARQIGLRPEQSSYGVFT
jgi:hypothetical protein